MEAKLSTHIRSNLVGYIAVFIALSGTAWAGGKIGAGDIAKNAVRSKQIKNDQVRSKDIRDQQVRAADVLDGSLTGLQLADESLTGSDIAPGAVGAGELAANGVRSVHVADNAIGSTDIADHAIGSADIADNAVETGEIAADAVTSADIASRAVGSDELGFFTTRRQSVSVPPNGGVAEVVVDCPAGSRRLTGAASFEFASGDLSATARDPDSVLGWRAQGQNNGSLPQDLTVEVLCLV